MADNEDILGFSFEARAGQSSRVCLDLMMALADEMEAEGITEQPQELGRRYNEVLAGRRPCPLLDTCERYRRAVERGGRLLARQPVQLSFLHKWTEEGKDGLWE